MARRQHSELAAGLFVLAALAVGVAALIWLGVAEVFTQRGQTVFFSVRQDRGSLGLEVGSVVKVNDAPIGKISDISLDLAGKRTLYEARLERKDVLVHTDARAKSVAEFIGGASIVLEDFGSKQATPADAEHPVVVGEGASAMFRQAQEAIGYGQEQRRQFQATLSSVSSAARDVQRLAAAIAREVDEENKDAMLGRVRDIVRNLQAGSANLLAMTASLKDETDRANAASLLKKVHRIADNAEALASDAAGMVKTVRPDVEEIVSSLRRYTREDIAAILADLRKSNTRLVEIAADFKAISSTTRDIVVLNRRSIDEIIANMKSVSLNLNAAAKEIRRNPWRLLQKPDEKDIETQNVYDAARAFAAGAEQLDDALDRLKALQAARPEGVKPDDPELIRIRSHIQATFEKFRTVEDALWEMAK